MIATALEPGLPPAMGAFLSALKERGVKVAKVQLAGPSTVPGRVEHLAARAAELSRALVGANVSPILFIDDPGLGGGALPLAELELIRRSASDAGAIVGLHCCGQTRWAELLESKFEVISLDVRLSLDALLEERRAWLAFLGRGGTLCLGIIPTEVGARYDVGELCDSVEASLRATTPNFERALSSMLLSPACGLALHSVEAATRINEELKVAQARLRSLL